MELITDCLASANHEIEFEFKNVHHFYLKCHGAWSHSFQASLVIHGSVKMVMAFPFLIPMHLSGNPLSPQTIIKYIRSGSGTLPFASWLNQSDVNALLIFRPSDMEILNWERRRDPIFFHDILV